MRSLFINTGKYKKLLEGHWNGLYQVCFSWTHDTHLSADLVQETIESALKNQHKISDPLHLQKWLYTVLVNKWRDHCRRHKNHVSTDDVELTSDHSPELEHQYEETIRHMHKAMNSLSTEQREVLSLVGLQGFSYEQVGNILDIPVGTVMSRLCRARRLLREYLKESNQTNAADGSIRRVK